MLKRIVRIAAFAGLGLFAVIGAVALLRQASLPEFGSDWTFAEFVRAKSVPSPQLFQFERFYPGRDRAIDEYGPARSDHAAVLLAVSNCYGNLGNPLTWSPAVRARFLLELDEHSMHSVPKDGADPLEVLGQLNPFHAAAIAFSDRLSRDRLSFRKEFEDKTSKSRVYQGWSLIIGALATICMAFRSMMKGDNKLSITVSVFAICLSAAGTSITSWINFDGSTAIALRDQRAIAQLRQLHWRVEADVLDAVETCREPAVWPASASTEGSPMLRVDDWKARLEDILNSAADNIAQPGDIDPTPRNNHPPRQPDSRPSTNSTQMTSLAERVVRHGQ